MEPGRVPGGEPVSTGERRCPSTLTAAECEVGAGTMPEGVAAIFTLAVPISAAVNSECGCEQAALSSGEDLWWWQLLEGVLVVVQDSDAHFATQWAFANSAANATKTITRLQLDSIPSCILADRPNGRKMQRQQMQRQQRQQMQRQRCSDRATMQVADASFPLALPPWQSPARS